MHTFKSFANRATYQVASMLSLAFLSACGADQSPMSLKSGPEGTVMVVGTSASAELREPGFQFRIRHSDTPGMSLGTAAGDAEAARYPRR